MNNNEYQTVGLYEHNVASYQKIKAAFATGEKVVGIVHATGTGKSYNALQLAYDNKSQKIVYVVPSNGIIEHLKKLIADNPQLDLKRDFPNLEFRTYHSFISLDRKEIANIACDLLILDEFHHLGAPIWGNRINAMIATHPEMKILGMTAYTVRDRGTIYERDMANPDTNELFSRKIASRYDLCDAMIDGILPKPIYKSAYTNLMGVEKNLEERVQKLDASSKEYQEYMALLTDIKRRIHEAPSIPQILPKNIKPQGKYIYFCPPCAEEGTNDIETIKKEALLWFKQFVPEEDIVIYASTNKMGKKGKQNREAFYNDVTLDGEKVPNKLRVMFAINQYNEGIHAPNVDGVIMGRGTSSDMVYFEQLGRALAVRGNTKDKFNELEKCSIEELSKMCKSRDITYQENTSKEELIQKLIAPIVIDLTNNFDFIKNLENNLSDRLKEVQSKGPGHHRKIKIKDASFDIEIENQDLFEMLRYVSDRLTKTWEDNYNFAKIYYEHHGHLLIPFTFKTNDGYSYNENGLIKLGTWLSTQRRNFANLSPQRQLLLESINFVLDPLENQWQKKYELAKAYYEHHGHLNVPQRFKTNDGYTYAENGNTNLGTWLYQQRKNFPSLSKEKQRLLQSIKLVLNPQETRWQKNYELAKAYYEHYGNLIIPRNFTTNDGYTYDEKGEVKLGNWLNKQRQMFKNLPFSKQQLLQSIDIALNPLEDQWQRNYKLAKAYYEHYGNLLIPFDFKTNDGYTYDENGLTNLGAWIVKQRMNFSRFSKERQQQLQDINFVLKPLEDQWQRNYKLAKAYYEHHGNLQVPFNFKTNDGFTYDENGDINLGTWLSTQRQNFANLSKERHQLLQSIGFAFFAVNSLEERWQKKYELAKTYYEHYGNLEISQKFKTNDGYTYDEHGKVNLGAWISAQKIRTNPESKRGKLLAKIGMIWNITKNKLEIKNLCTQYNIDKEKKQTILSHISLQELKSKIEFLKEKNISLVTNDGILTDIFVMSSPDMQEKYGISLEELISKYYLQSQKDKGV